MPVATLPDELVLMIIDTCDRLEKDREKTLAALCRLAKRYREGAERVLYSRIELRPGSRVPVAPRTALHTVVHETRLRPHVKWLGLFIDDALTSICLPLGYQLQNHSLAAFRNLQHLSLVGKGVKVKEYTDLIPGVESILATAASLATFVSLAIEGTLVTSEPVEGDFMSLDPVPAAPSEVPPSSRNILAAIPSQIQHLSLVTSFFRPNDVAAFLSGSPRPPRLRTLRIGDEVGRGLHALMGEQGGPFEGLASALEEAGVELTTVP
ncbi:hypothetical protein JCM10450v2_006428 [Rhodotorula kratochvilovae]